MMLLLLLSLAQSGATPNEAAQIRVIGRATVTVEPEQASVDIGVTTEASEADQAGGQNATKVDSVLRALREALGAEAEFETLSYALRPNYQHLAPRDEPVLTGYVASNIVRATGLALDAVGHAIDVATRAGANNIQNITFSLREEDTAKKEALRRAASDARAKSETLAEALGVRVVRILSVTEGEAEAVHPMPMFRAEMAMAQADAPTPVEPGTIQIRASVTLVVEISQ